MKGLVAHLRQRTRIVLGRCERCRGDAGSSALEMVLLAPLMFLLTFLPIQVGLVLHAQHVAAAAAQEGARAARVIDLDTAQSQAAGTQRANDFAALLGGNTLQSATVNVSRSADQVTVVVDGTALGILPGIKLSVSGRSVSPVEQFAAP